MARPNPIGLALASVLPGLLLAACDGTGLVSSLPIPDAGTAPRPDAGAPAPDAGLPPKPDAGPAPDAGPGIDAGVDAGPVLPEDDAEIVSDTLPTQLECGKTATATVTVRNLGSATWTSAAGYALGAVDDTDPFRTDPRVALDPAEAVLTGSQRVFTIDLTAPAAAGTYTTDWRMVHDGVRWFGATVRRDVTVTCPVTSIDLSTATVMNSPQDIASWPETARITTLDLQANGVFIDFTKRDGAGSWPDVPFGAPGDSLEYTLWIVIQIQGQWYASGCIEYWRGLDRNGGPPSQYAMNWYYDTIRWGVMTTHQPAVGEQVGFFVSAGDARNNGNSLVQERSNVVIIPFPTDAGAVFTYP